MPAHFFRYSGGDLFRTSGGGGAHLVNIPGVNSLIGGGGMAIYTNVSIQLSETIQYFLTFDDMIKYIHFGKGVGSVTAEGIMYCNCSGNVPGAAMFGSIYAGLRGSPQMIVIGSTAVKGVLTGAEMSIISEPDTMAQFSYTFAIVDHQL
jgi:hypothetical protein